MPRRTWRDALVGAAESSCIEDCSSLDIWIAFVTRTRRCATLAMTLFRGRRSDVFNDDDLSRYIDNELVDRERVHTTRMYAPFARGTLSSHVSLFLDKISTYTLPFVSFLLHFPHFLSFLLSKCHEKRCRQICMRISLLLITPLEKCNLISFRNNLMSHEVNKK